MLPFPLDTDDPLARKFRQYVKSSGFPCVGAKAALTAGQLRFVVADDITSAAHDERIYLALNSFTKHYRAGKRLFMSFAILFRGPATLSEPAFEHQLWLRLQALTDLDVRRGEPHDDRVSADPASPHFSLSFCGEGFFAVGMHPNASRPARRFYQPAIVLNPHDQFEELRRRGLFEKMRQRISQRDLAVSGSVNPMLRDFGEVSEAAQYSGRIVEEGWTCPFHRKPSGT